MWERHLRMVPSQPDLEAALRLARELVGDVDALSVSTAAGQDWVTLAALPMEIVELDNVQYAAGDGPCVRAMRTGAPVDALLTEMSEQWPVFVPVARARRIERVLSVPVPHSDQPASLNLYRTGTQPLDEQSQALLALVVEQIGDRVSLERARAALSLERDQLLIALKTRERIGEAKGILMSRRGCTSEEAFDLLRRASQRSNRKLRDVAEEVIELGELVVESDARTTGRGARLRPCGGEGSAAAAPSHC